MDRIADALERSRENAVPLGAIRSNRVTKLREEPHEAEPTGIRYTRLPPR